MTDQPSSARKWLRSFGSQMQFLFCMLNWLIWSAALPVSAQPAVQKPAEQVAAAVSQNQITPTGPRQASSPETGAITGRVIDDDGHPVLHASVQARPARGGRPGNADFFIDDEGNFRLSNLVPGEYSLSAYAKGYLPGPIAGGERDERRQQSFRPGDSVTITLSKGGVITGRVTGANDEPVVAAFVNAFLVGNRNGRTVQPPAALRAEVRTDDLGVYRIYGLVPGSYLIRVSGHGQLSSQTSGYEALAPTYYPSATREEAVEVAVRAGEEVTGIDIRFRGERGHIISGTVALTDSSALPASITLTHVATRTTIASTYTQSNDPARKFTFEGVADGEYELLAQRNSDGVDEGALSPPRRITIKGADLTGVELRLNPLGSIAGRVILATAQAANGCEAKRPARFEEVSLVIQPDRERASLTSRPGVSRPSSQGDFAIHGLEAGRYRVTAISQNENCYIRAMSVPGDAPAKRPNDVARSGLALRPGERLTDLTITISEGAASVRGKVIAAVEGTRLPDRLRVHLVPAEAQAADEVLRFAEVPARSDGLFLFTRLAPGRYWLVVRLAPEDETPEGARRPVAWESDGRLKLRREAEAANLMIELQACQRITNYELRYFPSAPNR